MRLQIQRLKPGSLPLISEIPDYGIARLVGYNGTGKSLTIRVLELCAGEQSTFEPEAWRGFCQGLGRIGVTASSLHGAGELYWELDGEKLLHASAASGRARPETEWFEAIRRNGQDASLGEVRALFSVKRIGGDVGLIETLAEEAERSARDITLLAESLATSPVLAEVEALVSEILTILAPVSIDAIREHERAASTARADRESAEAVLQDALRRREALLQISATHERVEEARAGAAELDAEIVKLNESISEIEQRRAHATRELDASEAAAAKSEEARAELA
jgi:hypothetical protein